MRTIDGITELRSLTGKRAGESPWVVIDQATIDLFADATYDHNPIHVDPVAAAVTLSGSTIAHGYHTLALVGGLIQQTIQLDDIRMGLNYGIEKARFPHAVPVGSSVRVVIDVAEVVESKTDDGVDCHYHVVTEIAGVATPACVADIVFRYYPR